jgi:hypothetical protein
LAAVDMRVGEVLEVFSRGFELMEADSKTLTYMESNPEDFPHASYDKVGGGGGGGGGRVAGQ